MSKVWEFFENMNEAVYASDIDTYELIYLNKTARNLFHFKDKAAYKGKKCYEILQQCSSPCAMCTNKRLKPDEFYEWSRFNPMVNRSFLLKDTMVIDDGRRIRIEIAIDLDIQEMTKKTFSQFTDTEALINEGLRCALAEETPEQSINTLLQYLGQMFHSDRVYIFEKNKHGNFDNTFEWCTCGVSPQINMLHNIPPEALGTWPSTFQKGESVIIRNLDDIMSYDSVVYETLMPQNIKRLVTSPISRNQDIIAFYGIDNPPLDRMDHIAFMLQLFGHFIDSMLRRRNLVEKLENLSYYDQLTGAKNRHALNEQLASLTKGQSLGILYGDVMGLKQINDTLGHQAGDKALLYACEKLKSHFPEECVYRIGGDEFIVLIPGITENLFQSMIRSILADMAESSVHLALGSVWVEDCTDNAEKALSEADARMYEDKTGLLCKEQTVRQKETLKYVSFFIGTIHDPAKKYRCQSTYHSCHKAWTCNSCRRYTVILASVSDDIHRDQLKG